MKKLKQIEFNEELIGKKGIVINFRKPHDTPPEVFVSEYRKDLGKDCYVIAIDKDGNFHQFHEKGRFIKGLNRDEDLLMYQEVESRVFYVNEYEDFLSLPHPTKEDAISNIELDSNATYIRTIKLVEEIE
jgi:hypothetical protein